MVMLEMDIRFELRGRPLQVLLVHVMGLDHHQHLMAK